ncbi:MAG: acetate--CoA ligase family protein, partial [Halobacteriota archaeon]
PAGFNATFAQRMADAGPISFMSQSGAFITAVLDWAGDHGIGFRHIVSLGNKVDVDEATLLEAWGDDPGTHAIIGYLESVPRGRRFMDAARAVASDTPIVIVKAGRTDAGARAASSHTGAMAGSDRVVDAGFAQAGVVRARSAADLFDAAQVLSGQPVPDGPGLAIVSNAGGPAVLATDAAADAGLDLAEFDPSTLERLTDRLPDAADPYNPVDILGDAGVDRFRDTLELVIDDPNVDTVLALSAPLALLSYAELAAAIAEVHAAHDVPMVTCLMGGRSQTEAAVEHLDARSIPNYFDPARAVNALGALEVYRRHRARPSADASDLSVDREVAEAMFERARQRDVSMLGLEALDVLEAYGLQVPDGELVDDPREAERVARGLAGDTVVMKVVSPDISHKSDIGGVRVGVELADIAATYEDIVTQARNYRPKASILGVYVQEQLDLDGAVEVIVGANRDPQFGPVVLFGLGGIFVEVFEDVTLRVAPVDERMAGEMLDEIEASALLGGARGRPAVDRDAIVAAIRSVSQLVIDHPDVLELDINPLVATSEGAFAIDLRMTIDTT